MVDRVLAAAEGEPPLVAFDDACGDPQAEAGAIEVLGGVEGLKDARTHGRGHPVAGIGDGDADAAARFGEAG